MSPLVTMFGLVGLVILIAALLSGIIERHRFPQTLVFLLLGAVVGPYGLNYANLDMASPAVQTLATLGLTFILFTDAVHMRFEDIRDNLGVASVLLGPGTLITALVAGVAAHYLLDFGVAQSAIIGAALASTDPVLLRGLIQNAGTPESTRHALRLEGGLNDAVLLPIVLASIAAATHSAGAHGGPWWLIVARVVVIGLGAGALVGWLATRALEYVRERMGMRRDYEALYVIAIALTAFAAAEAIGGSGFIAAFAAAITIGALDVDLCECFFEYGEATTEMVLLFTFVLLGLSAIWVGISYISPASLLFAFIALVARPLILTLALAPMRMDRRVRWMIIWFGPRGLSSLLLVLLAVFAGVSGADELFAATALVVLLSVLVHGGSLMFVKEEPRIADAADEGFITLEQYDELVAAAEPVRIVDVRTDAGYMQSGTQAENAVRLPPNDAVRAATRLGLPYDTWLILYCT